MTERISVPPPIPSTAPKPKRKWRWLKIAAAIIIAGLLALRILRNYSPMDLELVRRDLFDAARDGRVRELANTGSKPVIIVGMTINDRTLLCRWLAPIPINVEDRGSSFIREFVPNRPRDRRDRSGNSHLLLQSMIPRRWLGVSLHLPSHLRLQPIRFSRLLVAATTPPQKPRFSRK